MPHEDLLRYVRDFLLNAGLLALLFSGDHKTGGVYSFYIAWLLFIAIRMSAGPKFSGREIRLQLATSVFVIIPLAIELTSEMHAYAHGYIYAVLVLNAIIPAARVVGTRGARHFSIALMVGLFVLSTISLYSQGVRFSYIFGPNVFYRIAAYAYLLFILSTFILNSRFKNLAMLLGLVATSVSIMATGSRGGVVTYGVILLLTVFLFRRTISLRRLLILIGLVVGVALQVREMFRDRLWRIFYFDAEGTSISARNINIERTLEMFSDSSIFSKAFGAGLHDLYATAHPHNVFFEALSAGGVYLGAAVLFTYVATVIYIFSVIGKAVPNSAATGVLLLACLAPGALVSGTLLENFFILSLGAVVVEEFASSVTINGIKKQYPDNNYYRRQGRFLRAS